MCLVEVYMFTSDIIILINYELHACLYVISIVSLVPLFRSADLHLHIHISQVRQRTGCCVFNKVTSCQSIKHYRDSWPTNNTFCEWGPLQCRQAQVSNFHGAGGASDEDVVTLEVSVDDRRSPRVKEEEAFENLSAPAPQNFRLHHLKALQIPVKKKYCDNAIRI